MNDEPMTVRRVPTGHGDRVDPPCDPTWDDFTRLRWEAAVVSLDTGMDVTVTEGVAHHRRGRGPWRRTPHAYDVRCDTVIATRTGVQSTMDYLHGIRFGAEQMAKRHRTRPNEDDPAGLLDTPDDHSDE